MGLRKRLRVIWSALTQDWRECRCACGSVTWSQRLEPTPFVCDACETTEFETWMAARGQKETA